MSKVRSIFRCAECGGASPKWVGRCPSCAEWNTLVEELDEPTPVASRAGLDHRPGRPHRRGRHRRVAAPLDRADRGRPGAQRRPRAGLGHAASAASRASASPRCCCRWRRRWRRPGPRCSTSRPRSPSSRCGCGPSGSARCAPRLYLASETALPHLVAHLDEVKPDLLIVDSIQTVYEPELSSAPGLGGPGARVRGPPRAPGQGAGDQHRAGRPRHQGRRAGRAAGARARGRHGAGVRGRAPPRAAPAAGVQAPVRVHRRARPVRDDRHRPVPGARRQRAVPGRPAPRRVGLGRRAHHRGPPAAAGRDPGARGRRPACRRPAGRPRASTRVGCRCCWPCSTGGPASRSTRPTSTRWRSAAWWCASRAPTSGLALAIASAAIGRPLPPDLVVCGEVGLGGELRQVAQSQRRLAEAARLGFTAAIVPRLAPEPPPGITALRADDLLDAIDLAGLAWPPPSRRPVPRSPNALAEVAAHGASGRPGVAGSTTTLPPWLAGEVTRCSMRSAPWRRASPCGKASTASCSRRWARSSSSATAPRCSTSARAGSCSTPRSAPSACPSWPRWTAPSSWPPTPAASPGPTCTWCPTPTSRRRRPAPGTAPPSGWPAPSRCRSSRCPRTWPSSPATSATRSTRSSRSRACSTGPTRPCRPSSATRTGSTRCPRRCPSSRSRTSSRCATWSCCCSAPRC